jgi:hypothetical protein
MSTNDDLTQAALRIGEILREDSERQRQEIADRIRSMLSVARTRAGGELAEALLQVMLVMDKWHAEALRSPGRTPLIETTEAAGEILAAIETGLGVRS